MFCTMLRLIPQRIRHIGASGTTETPRLTGHHARHKPAFRTRRRSTRHAQCNTTSNAMRHYVWYKATLDRHAQHGTTDGTARPTGHRASRARHDAAPDVISSLTPRRPRHEARLNMNLCLARRRARRNSRCNSTFDTTLRSTRLRARHNSAFERLSTLPLARREATPDTTPRST